MMTEPFQFITRVEDSKSLLDEERIDDFIKRISKKIRQSYPNERQRDMKIIREEFINLKKQL